MKCLALILAAISAVSGLWAAYKWYRASLVDFVPHWMENGRLTPVPSTEVVHWVNALRDTFEKSSKLNKTAAIWTAFSVAFAGLSTLAGAWT
jgi:hypothetical protein